MDDRHGKGSTIVTSQTPVDHWHEVSGDPAMTIAAIDRLVHHSVVVEMNVESYCQRAATTRKGRAIAKPISAAKPIFDQRA